MTDAEIAKLAGLIAVLWPAAKAPRTSDEVAEIVVVWRDFLADLPAGATVAAVRSYATEGHEWPPPVGLLRKIVVSAAQPVRAPDPTEVWGVVVAAMSSVGYTGSPSWPHPAVGQAVEAMGGWQHMCQTWTTDTEMSDRARFVAAYDAALKRAAPDPTPPRDRAVLDALSTLADRFSLPEGSL